jgi:predicted dinucleotide-binding enzyme
MKIVILGGSGRAGDFLTRDFHRKGNEVIVLSRNKPTTAWSIVQRDAETLARREFKEAIKIFETLANKDPQTYSADVMSAKRLLEKYNAAQITQNNSSLYAPVSQLIHSRLHPLCRYATAFAICDIPCRS